MKSAPSNTLSLRGRAMFAAVRQFGRAMLGLPGTATLVRPSIGDFTPLIWGGRRLTPDQVRSIIEQAVGGNIQQQWTLFDLMEDSWPRLVKNLNELKRAAARATYTVDAYAQRGEKPTDDARDRADTVDAALRNWRPQPATLELGFEGAVYDLLDAYGKGMSLLEITWQRHPDGILPRCAHLVHPSRYGWNADGNEIGLVTSAQLSLHGGPVTWQPLPPGQFWCGFWQSRSGVPGQTALLRCLAPYWCGITFGWEWLLNNAQIFGVPLRWATYDPNRADLLPTLTDMLTNLGSAGWAAFPAGTTMEFKEAVSRATDNPQVMIQAMADKACDLVILGQEASSESKPAGIGNGASELHGAVRADRLQDAAQWVADVLNYQLVPAVLRMNYGDELEPPTIVPDLAGEPDPKAKAERDMALLPHLALPKKWLYMRHGIPEPEGEEETVGGEQPAFDFPLDGDLSGLDTAPGGESLPESGPGGPNPEKSRINDDPGGEGIKSPTGVTKARQSNPPRSAVALYARAGRGFGRKGSLPGAYIMSPATRRALAAAHARDFAPVRAAAAPLLAAIEAGDLELVGKIEAFIADLDAMAPTVIGASELGDALEAALAEAAIAGAAGSYRRISTSKPETK